MNIRVIQKDLTLFFLPCNFIQSTSTKTLSRAILETKCNIARTYSSHVSDATTSTKLQKNEEKLNPGTRNALNRDKQRLQLQGSKSNTAFSKALRERNKIKACGYYEFPTYVIFDLNRCVLLKEWCTLNRYFQLSPLLPLSTTNSLL